MQDDTARDFTLTYEPVSRDDVIANGGRWREERDHWIRLFNRLQGAVQHHHDADRFKDDHDEALYKAMDAVVGHRAGGA